MAGAEPKPVTSQHHSEPVPPNLVRVYYFSCRRPHGAELAVHTQVGLEAEEGVRSSGVDSHPGATLGGVIAAAWLWRGCARKALLPLLCPPLHPCQEGAVLAGRRAGGAVLWGSKLGHPLGRALQ